jgi:S1-C subfamily serine protease
MTTRSVLDLPGVRQLHSRNLLFPAVVVLVVLGVLLQGAFLPVAPESAEAATEPPPPPTAFRAEFEKTPLAYAADYWLQVGEQWRPHIVLVGRDKTPAIVVAPRLAVSSTRAADDVIAEELALGMRTPSEIDEPPTETAIEDDAPAIDGGEEVVATEPQRPYRLLSVDTEHQVAVFELTTPQRAAPVADLSELQSGSHAIALGLTPQETLRITPGSVVSARVATDYPEQGSLVGDTLDLAVPFPEETRVAAVVDLDGGLLGVAFETAAGLRVTPAHLVRDIAREAGESKPCVSIETQDLNEQVRTVLGVREGVFVESVRKEAFFPEPSIQAGDIIMRWAGDTIPSRQAFEESYLAGEPGGLVRYLVLREGRRIRGATRVPGPSCRPVGHGIVPFPHLGAVLSWQAAPPDSVETMSGWRVMSILEGAPAAKAGVKRGDLIVAVQARRLSADNFRKSFEDFEKAPRPTVFTVLRSGRLQLLAVAPEPAPSPSD